MVSSTFGISGVPLGASSDSTMVNSGARANQTSYAGGGSEALAILIKELMAGGSESAKAMRAARIAEVSNVQGLRQQYSPEQAAIDAQISMDSALRKSLEESKPGIDRAAEGAGTSANSLRALLLQNEASKAAEVSAALGLKTKENFGGIATGLSQTLEALTRGDDTNAKLLIDAIAASKGTTGSSDNGSANGGKGLARAVTKGELGLQNKRGSGLSNGDLYNVMDNSFEEIAGYIDVNGTFKAV